MSASGCDRRARVPWLAAVVAGALLGACGEEDSGGRKAIPPRDVVAVVNGQAITRDAFERYVASAPEGGEIASIDAEVQRRLLLRMVDEELLFQRAIALGLHRRDPAAHRAILSAVIASVASEGEVGEPDEATLRSYYEENPPRIDVPERFAVEVVRVSDGGRTEEEVRREAEEVANRLREGAEVEAVLASISDSSALEVPASPLSLESLEQRAGPAVASAVSQLSAGEVSDPLRDKAGFAVVALRERHPPEAVPFDEVRGEVRSDYLRQRPEQALRETLEELRRAAKIRVLDEALLAP